MNYNKIKLPGQDKNRGTGREALMKGLFQKKYPVTENLQGAKSVGVVFAKGGKRVVTCCCAFRGSRTAWPGLCR